MHRLLTLTALIALALGGTQALAADAKAPAKKTVAAAKAPATKVVAKAPATVSNAAPAAAVDAPLTQAQLDIVPNVYTGRSDCEFSQTVSVTPVEGRPGVFQVAYGKNVYTMVPQETTTGAVRLEDKKAGALWLQIPSKSMLIDTKAGQRLVDACRSQQQRVAQAN